MVNGWLLRVQGAILPPTCVLCGGRGQAPVLDLCQPCAADFPMNLNPCRICAAPLSGAASPDLVCGQCLRKPPRFDRALVPFRYSYPLDELLRRFKYRGILAYGRVLGTVLAEHLALHCKPLPQLVIPVPLHPTRHRERGFNQASELARSVARRLSIRIDDRLCERLRATADQTQLDAKARRGNVRRAFALARKPDARHVAILDDVLTTGSTANEIARVLKRSGVRQVDVWAVARAHSANT